MIGTLLLKGIAVSSLTDDPFEIDVTDIRAAARAKYPRVSESHGEAPKQYG
jgi:hypothetical protein